MRQTSLFLTLLLIAGCGEGMVLPSPPTAPAPDPDPDPDPSPAPEGLEIRWIACSQLAGAFTPGTECAQVAVPLDWSNKDGDTIDLYAKRVRAVSPENRSVWLLAGGPGQAASALEGLAAGLIAQDSGLDVYLLDHRGTGASTRLGCQVQEAPSSEASYAITRAEWPECRDTVIQDYGEGLASFSATNAALDLRAMIDATRAPDEQVFVLGISYGTYLAQRYLQVAPDQAAGVIFDSICAADRCYLSEQDLWENRVAEQIMNRCADEPECAQRLGATPWSQVEALYAQASDESFSCQIGASPQETIANLRVIMASLMFSGSLRRVAPAFVHRMLRCNAADQMALQTMITALFGGGAPAPSSYSFPLAVNIAISELWESSAPTITELEERNSGVFSARGVSAQLGWQTDGWPVYKDPLAGQLPSSSVPVLMMNASLDPATPLEVAQPLSEALNGPNQHFIEIPGSAHSVVSQGPLQDNPNNTCGRLLALQFMKDPKAPLDTSCLQRTVPLSFSVSAGLANFLFGTTDLWGD